MTLTALDLFCGIGGASIGIERAGYHVTGYDVWPYAVEAHLENGLPAKIADLSTFRFSKKRRGKVDLLWASPPCQPFSNAHANEGTDGRWDPRDGFPHYLRALRRIMPRLTIVENVAGLTYRRHADYLAKVLRSISSLGYTVDYRLLDCSDFRIPQRRKRLIIIGRLDEAPRWPKPSDEKISVYDALGTDGSDNPPGAKVVYTRTPTATGGFRGALLFNGRGRPLDLDEPSLTIYASGGNHVHWFDTEDVARPYFAELLERGQRAARTGEVPGAKRLTPRQMATLQGFPKRYRLIGSPSTQVQGIGNAVPPRLARLLVKKNLL